MTDIRVSLAQEGALHLPEDFSELQILSLEDDPTHAITLL